jgi:hypothetical protein
MQRDRCTEVWEKGLAQRFCGAAFVIDYLEHPSNVIMKMPPLRKTGRHFGSTTVQRGGSRAGPGRWMSVDLSFEKSFLTSPPSVDVKQLAPKILADNLVFCED